MSNIADLRADLVKLYDDLNNDNIDPEKASLLTNCAGKIIGTIRVEIEYAELRDESIDIEYMNIKTTKKKK